VKEWNVPKERNVWWMDEGARSKNFEENVWNTN
jgi:hypothetical protein